MNRIDTAVSAATKLALFVSGELQLHEAHYDALVDAVVFLIEESRDLQYKLLVDDFEKAE